MKKEVSKMLNNPTYTFWNAKDCWTLLCAQATTAVERRTMEALIGVGVRKQPKHEILGARRWRVIYGRAHCVL